MPRPSQPNDHVLPKLSIMEGLNESAGRNGTVRSALLLLAILLVGTTLLSACAGSTTGKNSGAIQHVIFCWLKEPGNEEARQRLIDVSYEFKSIPGVVDVHAGRALPSDRPIVDDSFDVGIVIVLENSEALTNYSTNPQHLKALKEVLGPLADRILIYDIYE